MKIGILGAGALGLSAGVRLAQAGHRVEVIERETCVGGLAAGFRVGPSWLEKFYHHLFRSDKTIIRWIDELGLTDRLLWLSPDTSTIVDGKVWSLDSAPDVLKFGPLSPVDRIRLGACLAYLKVLPNPRSLACSTAAQWLRRWMGESTYRVVWEPLLRGKFQRYAEEIAMPWFWGRVHCRTPQLGYLRGGFQQLYERMAEEIGRMGGKVRLGESAERIESSPAGQVVVQTSAGTSEYERLLVTLPTRLFVQLADGLPSDYVSRYRAAGDHLSAHCTVLALDRPLTSIYWLNIGDPGYPFLSLVEHTNLMPPEDYGGRRLVYLGNYLPPDHPLFSMPGEEILAGLWPALKRINPRFEPGWVTESWHFQAPFAQPIVRRGYPDQLAPHQTPLPNVLLANMGHIYPQDRGQNYSILLGENISRLLLGQPGWRTS